MELKWFEVDGDIDNINSNIFNALNNMEVFLNKALKVRTRLIFLNKETGLLHCVIEVMC